MWFTNFFSLLIAVQHSHTFFHCIFLEITIFYLRINSFLPFCLDEFLEKVSTSNSVIVFFFISYYGLIFWEVFYWYCLLFTCNFPDHFPDCLWFSWLIQFVDIILPVFSFVAFITFHAFALFCLYSIRLNIVGSFGNFF